MSGLLWRLMSQTDEASGKDAEAPGIDWQQSFGLLWDKLQTWLDELILRLPNIIIGVAVVVAFWILARIVRSITVRTVRRVGNSSQLGNLSGVLAFLLVMLAGVSVALGVVGLEKTVTSLLTGAGIVGLALGLAFQSLGSNFIAGTFLSLNRPFQIGDVIESNDVFGKVHTVDLRATTILTPQGKYVQVPNHAILESALHNYTKGGIYRVDLPVGVSYGENLDEVQQITRDAVAAGELCLKHPELEVFFTEFGNSSINLEVRFWTAYKRQADFVAARSEAVMNIKRAYDKAGITIPFPIRTLDFGIKGGEKMVEQLNQLPGFASPGVTTNESND